MKEALKDNKNGMHTEFEKIRAKISSGGFTFAEEMKADCLDFMEKMKEVFGTVKKGVDEKIGELTGKVEEQTSELATSRADMKELQEKVKVPEKRESDVSAMWKEKERRRDIEDEIKKEFRDNEDELIVTGYDGDEGDRNVKEDLIRPKVQHFG